MSTHEKTKQKKMTSSAIVTLEDVALTMPEKRASQHQFATWVYTLMNNWRQGTVGVKDRSEVNRTNKKPFKQKGTGRARAGSARSPLWRGGGVVFGPQARTKKIRVGKQLKQQVLTTLAADFITNQKVHMIDWVLPQDQPKTRYAAQLLKDLALHNKNVVLFLSHGDVNTYASFINIPHVQIILFDQPNVFDLSRADYWVYLKKDHDAFKEMVEKWQN